MHIPVLSKEVIEYLNPKRNENFIDCTIDGGGHSFSILQRIQPDGKLLGIDWDKEIISKLKLKIQKSKIKNKKNIILANKNFANLKRVVQKYKFGPVSGILFDLGMSTWHIKESKKGFSFLRNEIIDMRYSKDEFITARQILNDFPQKKIERILREYGEEEFSDKISRAIIEQRQKGEIKTTYDLVDIIRRATPSWYQHKRIHPATKTFQALRISVNQELHNLREGLTQALEVLAGQGRLVVISFHSLEDRIVKDFFKKKSREQKIKIMTKKPIRASIKEIKLNHSASSAKLRAIVKL